jgi:hypothetical protein
MKKREEKKQTGLTDVVPFLAKGACKTNLELPTPSMRDLNK